MLYRSTRGGSPDTSFEDALFSGYAPDGGLYMPQEVPRLTQEEQEAWAGLSYRQVMAAVARKFISEEEVPSADLSALVDSALARFPKDAEVVVKNVSPDTDTPLWILELFHGPTLVFKDLALSFVAALLQYFLAKKRRQISIIVATSGDTGGSAIAAVEGRPDMALVVLLPEGRISEPQRLQMVTSPHDNVTVYAAEGTSDEMDVPVKALFADAAFVARHRLLSINSINVGRIIGQVAHFVYGYYRRRERAGGAVEVVVPTGAAGNITSGALAAALGLPLTAVCATNANDVTAQLLSSGRYRVGGEMKTCLASAMDIQAPYNVERLLYLYSGGDVELVRMLMTEFEAKGEVEIPGHVMTSMKSVITGCCSYPDSAVLAAIRRAHAAAGYLMCPHTAEGVALHYDRPSTLPRLYIAPAAPTKFPEVVRVALSLAPPLAAPALEAVMEEVCRPLMRLRKLAEGGTKELKLAREEDWKKVLEDRLEVIRARRRD